MIVSRGDGRMIMMKRRVALALAALITIHAVVYPSYGAEQDFVNPSVEENADYLVGDDFSAALYKSGGFEEAVSQDGTNDSFSETNSEIKTYRPEDSDGTIETKAAAEATDRAETEVWSGYGDLSPESTPLCCLMGNEL